MKVESHKAKPMKKVLPVIAGMINLQMRNTEVAIPFLQGPPGIGKTMMTENEFINKWGFNFIATHYGLTPYEDVSGIPDFSREVSINGEVIKTSRFTPPDLLAETWKVKEKSDKPIVVFLDDFHLAPPSLKNLGYEIFTKKSLRGYPFPDNCAFLIAGNVGEKAGAENIPSPITNRLAIIDVNLPYEDWKTDYAIPFGINNKIITFLNRNHHRYFQEEEQINLPWTSPRSWALFSTLLNTFEQFMQKDDIDVLYWASKHLGDTTAAEFAKYYKIYSEIDISPIFDKNDISLLEIPNELNKQYILTIIAVHELVTRYKEGNDKQRQKDIYIFVQIIEKIANTSKEIAVTGLNEIITSEKSLKLRNLYSKIKNSLDIVNSDLSKKLNEGIMML